MFIVYEPPHIHKPHRGEMLLQAREHATPTAFQQSETHQFYKHFIPNGIHHVMASHDKSKLR